MKYRATRQCHLGDNSHPGGVGTKLLLGDIVEWDGASSEAKVVFTDKVVYPESDSFMVAVRKGWLVEIEEIEEPAVENEADGWDDDPLGL